MTSTTTKKRTTRTRKTTAKPKPVITETYPVVITKEATELDSFGLALLPFLYLEYFVKLLMRKA